MLLFLNQIYRQLISVPHHHHLLVLSRDQSWQRLADSHRLSNIKSLKRTLAMTGWYTVQHRLQTDNSFSENWGFVDFSCHIGCRSGTSRTLKKID